MPTTRKPAIKSAKPPAKRSTNGTRASRTATTVRPEGNRRTNGAVTSRGRRNGHNLVIVESPAKARTIAGILGPGFEITASVGHVRDLPKSKLGVDIAREFEPQYIVPKEKRDVVNHIKEAATRAGSVYLATDPDREG